MENQRKIIKFQEFRQYFHKFQSVINCAQTVDNQQQGTINKVISYKGCYKKLQRKFAKDHDCQFFQLQCLMGSEIGKIFIKVNFMYSLAYQIPLFLFMPYHIQQDMNPYKKDQVDQILNLEIGSQRLKVDRQQSGVYMTQNWITKQYFYSLHHCQMGSEFLQIKKLIPYYLGLINCHPIFF